MIALGAAVLAELGVADRAALEINTLGNAASRAAYRETLLAYLTSRRAELSPESLRRLERNPLRILDSKEPQDREAIADAPPMGDSLDAASAAFFDAVKRGLDALGVAFTVNPRLVRGLDYYCHTAFEFTAAEIGAQGAVMAGGRYDGLVAAMGGPETAGVGWAAGIERLAMLAGDPPPPARPVAVVPVGEAAQAEALRLTDRLRRRGIAADLAFRGNLKRRMSRADRIRARAAVLLGEDELAAGAATVRDLDSGEQERIALSELADHLAVRG